MLSQAEEEGKLRRNSAARHPPRVAFMGCFLMLTRPYDGPDQCFDVRVGREIDMSTRKSL